MTIDVQNFLLPSIAGAPQNFNRSVTLRKNIFEQLNAKKKAAILHGAAGSGKSSFLADYAQHQSTNLDIIHVKIKSNPTEELAHTLVKFYQPNDNTQTQTISKTLLINYLTDSNRGISEGIEKQGFTTKQNVTLVLDQFEQIFCSDISKKKRNRWFKLLTDTIKLENNIKIIIVLDTAFLKQMLYYYDFILLTSGDYIALPTPDLAEITHILTEHLNPERKSDKVKKINQTAENIAIHPTPLHKLKQHIFSQSLIDDFEKQHSELPEKEKKVFDAIFVSTIDFLSPETLLHRTTSLDFISNYTGLAIAHVHEIIERQNWLFDFFFVKKQNKIHLKSIPALYLFSFTQNLLQSDMNSLMAVAVETNEMPNKLNSLPIKTLQQWLLLRNIPEHKQQTLKQKERKRAAKPITLKNKYRYAGLVLILTVATLSVWNFSFYSELKKAAHSRQEAQLNEARAKKQLKESFQHKKMAEMLLYNTLELQKNNLSLLKQKYQNAPQNKMIENQLLESYDNVSWYLMLNEDFIKALSVIDEALKISPDANWLRINKTVALALSNRLDDAKKEFLTLKDKPPQKEEYKNSHYSEVAYGILLGLEQDGITHPNIDSLIGFVGQK